MKYGPDNDSLYLMVLKWKIGIGRKRNITDNREYHLSTNE